MKRIDAVLRDEQQWEQHQELLTDSGITWNDVQTRKQTLERRKKESAERALIKREVEKDAMLRAAHDLVQNNPFAALSTTVAIHPNNSRPISLSVNMAALLHNTPTPIINTIQHAIRSLFKGCVRGSYAAQSNVEHLEATLPVFLRLAEDAKIMERALADILSFTPGAIETINTPEATDLAGVPRAVFDAAVQAHVIPIAATERFHKWGRTLEAKRFEVRDVLQAVKTGALRNFQTIYEGQKTVARKKGAERGQHTRTQRAILRARLSQESRARYRQAARSTGTLTAAYHLELFEWAQHASRLAKTKPSQQKQAYELKDDALLALYEAGALNITFVDAEQHRIVHKCKKHRDDWYCIEELVHCKSCKTVTDHDHSLYAMRLTCAPELGGLHLPYPIGSMYGLPAPKDLEKADHRRDVAYGRTLDEDEVAIFTLANITRAIERLVAILAPQPEN